MRQKGGSPLYIETSRRFAKGAFGYRSVSGQVVELHFAPVENCYPLGVTDGSLTLEQLADIFVSRVLATE